MALTYVLADEIVFTNENQLAYMLGYCSNRTVRERAERKAVIMPQPSLPSRFYDMIEYPYELDRDQTNLAYFGNFYASRGPDDLLAAIAGLEADLRARLRLHLFTSRPEEVTARAQALGIGECVRANPYVKYLQFLGLAARFDCLIVNDALTGMTHAVNPYLPSKYADYHGSGAPVWGLVERGSPLSAERLAYTSPIGDVEAVRQTLRRMLDLPRET